MLERVDGDLISLISRNEIKRKPLLVCSGGTTSRCASEGHWTLDLRKNYTHINFNNLNQIVEIEGGVSMGSLIKALANKNRSFPIGLSRETGVGYILTGGISPLSRSKGLAIDNILRMKGIWGSGENFDLKKPNSSSLKLDQLKWRGLCGAAPFMGIVTNITLKTYQSKPLLIWESILSPYELSKCILRAEKWPDSASFQWIWGDKIKGLAIIEIEDEKAKLIAENLINELPNKNRCVISNLKKGIVDLKPLELPIENGNSLSEHHSEVLGIIGPDWGDSTTNIINIINEIMNRKPNKYCYIASQQLGGETSRKDFNSTGFIHRDATWKPWINVSWPAGKELERQKSLKWLEELWGNLESNCPGVHLAQLHNHLSWHKKEIRNSFNEFLPDLKYLKSICDPKGILPNLN